MSTTDATRAATLTPARGDIVFRAALARAIRGLELSSGELASLRDAAELTEIDIEDAQGAVRLVREELDALDALGWPQPSGRGES